MLEKNIKTMEVYFQIMEAPRQTHVAYPPPPIGLPTPPKNIVDL